jgi:hypothetical protein
LYDILNRLLLEMIEFGCYGGGVRNEARGLEREREREREREGGGCETRGRIL